MTKLSFNFLWLAVICIAVFLLQVSIPGFTELFVLNNKSVEDLQVWRFITSIFLHGDIIHLIYNLFALLFFGIILEKLVGAKKFLIVFFSSGIIANIIAVNFYESSLGASGAIYGVLGAVAVIKPFMMIWAFGLILPMFVAVILWITADILRYFGFFGATNIGSIAHLSGIAVGFILSLFFIIWRKRKIKKDKLEIPEVYIENWENRNMGNFK